MFEVSAPKLIEFFWTISCETKERQQKKNLKWSVKLQKTSTSFQPCKVHSLQKTISLFNPKGVILGSILFPVRVTLAALFFLILWPIARLRFAGLSAEQRSRPVTGWRCWLLHPIVWLLSRVVFFSLGFVWVKVKGRRADLKEAPVLVVAPHSGFLDMLVMFPTQLPTVVSRSENTSLPVIGGEIWHTHAGSVHVYSTSLWNL